MLFYFSPLFLTCGTLSLFSIRIKRFNWGVIYFVAGVLCVSIIPTWQPVVGGQLDPRITTSQDLYSLANNDLLRSLKTINIQLSPYLESMLAAAIVPTKFRSISSESYFPIHTELGTCTLIRLDNPIVEEYKSSVTYLNGTYGLIPLPTTCKWVAFAVTTIPPWQCVYLFWNVVPLVGHTKSWQYGKLHMCWMQKMRPGFDLKRGQKFDSRNSYLMLRRSMPQRCRLGNSQEIFARTDLEAVGR